MKFTNIVFIIAGVKVFLILILIVVVIFIINKCSEKLDNTISEYDTIIGKQVVIKQDTLVIIDYSFIHSLVILEDGREIRYSFAKTIVIEDNK